MQKNIPFGFVFDYLEVDYTVKSMFLCYGVYANGLLCLFIGKYLVIEFYCTTAEHSKILLIEFPEAEAAMLKIRNAG